LEKEEEDPPGSKPTLADGSIWRNTGEDLKVQKLQKAIHTKESRIIGKP